MDESFLLTNCLVGKIVRNRNDSIEERYVIHLAQYIIQLFTLIKKNVFSEIPKC